VPCVGAGVCKLAVFRNMTLHIQAQRRIPACSHRANLKRANASSHMLPTVAWLTWGPISTFICPTPAGGTVARYRSQATRRNATSIRSTRHPAETAARSFCSNVRSIGFSECNARSDPRSRLTRIARAPELGRRWAAAHHDSLRGLTVATAPRPPRARGRAPVPRVQGGRRSRARVEETRATERAATRGRASCPDVGSGPREVRRLRSNAGMREARGGARAVRVRRDSARWSRTEPSLGRSARSFERDRFSVTSQSGKIRAGRSIRA
jgi:hypothetical protein